VNSATLVNSSSIGLQRDSRTGSFRYYSYQLRHHRQRQHVMQVSHKFRLRHETYANYKQNSSKQSIAYFIFGKIRQTSTPAYLDQYITARSQSHRVRSSTVLLLSEPYCKTAFAKRAHQCAAPAVWNTLPKTITDSNSLAVFKSRLKTLYFSLTYD
jgi:hypothetical protein